MTTPTFRPADTITDPALFALARARWPGFRVTSEMLSGIAILEGRPLHVPATPEAVAAGLAEVRREQRLTQQQAANASDYTRMGFDPARDYRNPTTTEK